MKTEQEIQEADKRERKIKIEKMVADKAAQWEYNDATKEAWEEYDAVWKPAREKWEAFQGPYFKTLQGKLVAANKAEMEALAEVRANWKECPRCGLSAARYQVFCTGDKCRANLLTYSSKIKDRIT